MSGSADSRGMRVGMDLTFMGDKAGGMGRYVRNLLPALTLADSDLRITAFVGTEVPGDFVSDPALASVHWCRLPVRPRQIGLHRLLQRTVLPARALTSGLDVFHNPATFGPRRLPGVPVVTTLFEMIAIRYSQTQVTDERAGHMIADAVTRAALSAERILAASHAAAKKMVVALGIDPDRVDVAPLGVCDPVCPATPEAELRRRYDLGERDIMLCVAQKLDHKNQELLIRLLPGMREDNVVLVMPGSPTPYEARLKTLAYSLGVSELVRMPPWLSEADLEGMYAAARCVVLPSWMEGFGLPVLEAMARGVPVACSNRWALPEVAGGAAVLFEPDDPASAKAAITTVLHDEQRRMLLVDLGRKQSEQFTWERCARETLKCYRRAIKAGRGS